MTGNPFDPALFRPEAIAPETRAFNQAIAARMKGAPKWWEDPEGFRRSLPTGPASPRAVWREVPAPDGRRIRVRVIAPDSPTGVYLHFHGGGLVMGAPDQNDALLERIADNTGLACVSVEYRLAPQHPHPAAWDDCEAVAVWLAREGKSEFGSDVLMVGGESAGATLAVPILVRMRDKHGFTGFKAANLSYGNYDTTMTPSQVLIGRDGLFLQTVDIQHCSDAYAPDRERRRDPDISALYAPVDRLPPALFTVGTADPFLDDSLFLYVRWVTAGNEAALAIYPGGIHAFNIFPYPLAAEANRRIDAFLKAHL
jgi:acetyl esterase/lipase